MARGYTTITLKGGTRDGEIVDEVPLRHLPETLSFPSEAFFAKSSNGGICIMKGKLNDQWLSYSVDIYAKLANEKHKPGVVFKFIETIDVERCSAMTKKHKQCLKPALHNTNYCCVNHK